MRFIIILMVIVTASAGVSLADVSITVYNRDLALVRESRDIEFDKGVSDIRFPDVTSQIIPTSVHFSSRLATLLEQNYEYDLVDSRKLMNRYLDENIELITEGDRIFRGKLLSAYGDVVIQQSDGTICSIAEDKVWNVKFPNLPDGLITRPTLVWKVDCKKGGKGKGEVSYLTTGMSWESEYVAVISEDDDAMNLTGWVNITNNSGASFENARLKLMAGDVKIEKKRSFRAKGARSAVALAYDEGASFDEMPFYEYHLYTLQRPSTLKNNQVKQISLFPEANIRSVEKEYRFNWKGQRRNSGNLYHPDVTLIFKNEESNGLGIPLPEGLVRVYKQGPDESLEFVGENRIDHIPSRETVRVNTGSAFDIVAEYTRMDVKQRGKEQMVEIKLRSHKKKPVEVIVPDYLHGDWEMIEATSGWEKKDAYTVEWKVTLQPEVEKVIQYRVLKKD